MMDSLGMLLSPPAVACRRGALGRGNNRPGRALPDPVSLAAPLLQNLADRSGTDRAAAFADGKTHLLFHRDGLNQLNHDADETG